jgi:4-amino-4-deoxy-L-arabinose transferase-like glycosyltransferase
LNKRIELLLVTGLLLLAALLRTWDLARLPPGFSDNELAYLRMTETVHQRDVAVYYQVGDGHGRAGMYAVGNALVMEMLGGGLFGYRILPLWAGMLALALLYALARRLFGVPVALIALGVMSTNLRAVILARTASAEALMPAYVLLTLLVLAAAFNLRHEIRFRTPTTSSFALLAVLFGAAGYLNYTGLVLGPLAVVFFVHLLITRQPMSRRVWSAAIFVIVLATVVAMPYLISTLREPKLSEPYLLWTERPHSLGDGAQSVVNAIGSVFLQGDRDPSRNLPGVPLVGPVMAVLLVVGLAVALRRWREPRYALVLIVLAAGLLTDSWVGTETTFSADLVALPAVYILPGIGVMALWRELRGRGVQRAWQSVALILVVLLAANVIAVGHHVFQDWRHDPQVAEVYHAHLGYLAIYLDRTPHGLPVSMCAAHFSEPQDAGLSPRHVLELMMHRQHMLIRHSDCRSGLVLINAGAPMRFVFADISDRLQMPPELAEWLSDATPIHVEGLQEGSVLYVDVEQRVRDAGGYWDAFSPVFFMPDEHRSGQPIKLPVQLEHNLTFAGYDPRVFSGVRVAGGEPIVLVTYWRVDGRLPTDLGIFAHLLAYPDNRSQVPLLEPWAEANAIDVIPTELRERDFFAQVSYIWLGKTLAPAQYALTVGAYVDQVAVLANHLEVLDSALNYQPHGDRLLLGNIAVQAPPAESQ